MTDTTTQDAPTVPDKPILVKKSPFFELAGQTMSAGIIAGCAAISSLSFRDPTVTASVVGFVTALLGLGVWAYRALRTLDKHDKVVTMAAAAPNDVARVVK